MAFGSARLTLKFFEELPWNDAAGAPGVGGRTPLDLAEVAGADRLATMAALALRECAGESTATSEPAPLLLCLPAPVSPDAPAPATGVLPALIAHAGVPIDPSASRSYHAGRSALFDALDEAVRLLSSRAARVVYLGGVDSCVDREPFDRALRAGRIKSSTTPGMIPGEGAVFLRLALEPGPGALATLAGLAHHRGAEDAGADGADQAVTGSSDLATAALAALAAAEVPIADVGAFIHGVAGERSGFREVALAISRLHARTEPPPAIISTAACAGEMGAAAGPFALALAAFLLQRGVTDGAATLVLSTGDDPTRGAAVLTRPRRQAR